MLEALKGYVQLATGLAEVTVGKAREVAGALVNQGLEVTGAVPVPGKDHAASAATAAAGQVAKIADDLVETSEQNRELLVGLVRTEVDRAAGRMGFVREEELAAVRRHVSRLESSLAEVRAQVGAPAASAPAAQAAETVEATTAVEAVEAAGTPDAAESADAPGPAPRVRKKKVVVARRTTRRERTRHDSTPYDADAVTEVVEGDPAATVVEVAPTIDVVDEDVVEADPIDAIDDGSDAVGPGAAHEQTPSGTARVRAVGPRAAGGPAAVTGDPRIDAATARLGDLAELPTSDHVAVYDDVHRRLQDALADAEVR